MAKTYLEVYPSAKLLVVDESQSVGGTWARERLYPGLKTNNLFGSYELGDFPMVPEKYGVKHNGHIPGHVVHEYLCDFADHFGITPHLSLGTKVISAYLQDDDVWNVNLKSVNGLQRYSETVRAAKLIIATGLTSKPHVPQILGSENFGRLMLHSKQLKEQSKCLTQCNKVVVIGGNKSAWDVCYTAARAGSQVHMVIRPSGGGASYVWPCIFPLGPFKVSLAMLSRTRLFTLFDPEPLNGTGPFAWMKKFMHRTSIGQKFTRWFWNYLDRHIRKLNGYSTHPELKKLEPWITPFWMGNSLSIHNYDTSWFDLVREGKIHIHIADVASLSPGNVHLANGDTLETDALVFCTGWTVDMPVKLDPLPLKNEEQALKAINMSVPYLQSIPRRTSNAPACQEFHLPSKEIAPIPPLYRSMIPADMKFLQHRNFAMIGMAVSVHAALVAQAQALWITAFLNNKISYLRPENLNIDELEDITTLQSLYGRLRRPQETGGLAGKYADLVFDSLPYIDELLSDLGLQRKRKGSWWRELTEDYHPADYQGLAREWMSLDKNRSDI